MGTGTGLITLMMAQRNLSAKITAIDISREAVNLADENFRNSPFQRRLCIVQSDFKEFSSTEKFDLIVSNPPYFEENPSVKDIAARQQTELSFLHLIENAAANLSYEGILSVIIPFVSGDEFESLCFRNQLHLNKKITVFGMRDSKPKRLIMEFGFAECKTNESEFVIEKSPRKYTDAYLELTKDFHLFGK